jgi:selenocysteine lyase/cysteine desulfurase
MAGEGACFMHCPPGWGRRPRDTGWFAAFGDLSKAQGGQVAYSDDGWRFMGATFDPSGLYRFNAVMRWLDETGVTVEAIHEHALALQNAFLAGIAGCEGVDLDALVVPADERRRGNFLTFDRPDAQHIHDRLKSRRIVTDVRGRRLRFGFGLYQTRNDVTELLRRIEETNAFAPTPA